MDQGEISTSKAICLEGDEETRPGDVVGGEDWLWVDEVVEFNWGKTDEGKPDEGSSVDTGRNVGDSDVWPKQLPLLIDTSSMAKSPVKDDPLIPSNVT